MKDTGHLDELERKLDEALAKETPETLKQWLYEKKSQSKFYLYREIIIREAQILLISGAMDYLDHPVSPARSVKVIPEHSLKRLHDLMNTRYTNILKLYDENLKELLEKRRSHVENNSPKS